MQKEQLKQEVEVEVEDKTDKNRDEDIKIMMSSFLN